MTSRKIGHPEGLFSLGVGLAVAVLGLILLGLVLRGLWEAFVWGWNTFNLG